MGSALGAVYDGGGRRQEALGQAGRFLSKRVLPPAVGTEVDGLSFFYAGREHAAIAPMREKYTAMYPATAPSGADCAREGTMRSLSLPPRGLSARVSALRVRRLRRVPDDQPERLHLDHRLPDPTVGSVSVAPCQRVEQARDESVHLVLDRRLIAGRGTATLQLGLGERHHETIIGGQEAVGGDTLSLPDPLLVAAELRRCFLVRRFQLRDRALLGACRRCVHPSHAREHAP